MTSPAPADMASVKNVLQNHVNPAVSQMVVGGSLSFNLSPAAVHQVTIPIAVNAVAGRIQAQASPEVLAEIGHFQTQFDGYRSYLAGVVRQCSQFAVQGAKIAEFDFIKKTGHGGKATSAASKLEGFVSDANEALTEMLALETKLPLVQDTAGFAPFAAFEARMQTLIASGKALGPAVGALFAEAIEFEAIKAIVMADPANTHREIKVAFGIVDQALHAMRFTGGLFGLIPSPFTTPVAAALGNASRALAIVSAMARREAIAQQNASKVEEYRNTHAKADAWAAHDADPTLMAERVAKKRKADLQIILLCADAAIGPLTDLVPAAAPLWTVARQSIESAIKKHTDQRLANLREPLGRPDPLVDPVKAIAKEFGAALVAEFREDLTKALNPLDAVFGAVTKTAMNQIAERIMKRLPIDPADAVDGDALKTELDELTATAIAGMPPRDDALTAQLKAAEAAATAGPPTQDNRRNKVEMVLSDVLADDGGRAYRLVRIGGVVGALYLDNQEFRPGQADSTTNLILSALPTADLNGRPIDEADLNVGFARKHPAPPNMQIADKHMWVRIGAVWGYIDTGTKKFWPSAVDKGAFAKWDNRIVKKEGYYENGTLVEGKWYRPFPHNPSQYLFVGANGSREWARPQDNTGSGKGAGNTIADRAKVHNDFDASTL